MRAGQHDCHGILFILIKWRRKQSKLPCERTEEGRRRRTYSRTHTSSSSHSHTPSKFGHFFLSLSLGRIPRWNGRRLFFIGVVIVITSSSSQDRETRTGREGNILPDCHINAWHGICHAIDYRAQWHAPAGLVCFRINTHLSAVECRRQGVMMDR